MVAFLAVVVGISLFISCAQAPTEEQIEAEREVVARTVSSCLGWFKNKDFDLLFSVVANDSNYISVRPTGTVLKGYDEFLKSAEIFKNPKFTYVRHELKDLTINFSRSGDVAWFYCILDDINDWDGRPANWENTRWTGVVEKRDGKWVIAQQHFSFAAE
jgi:ketosteroid isomerase-like protein